MSKKSQEAFCKLCKDKFNGIPKRTFFGFINLKCPKCNTKVFLPLTKGYKIAYWVIGIWGWLWLFRNIDRIKFGGPFGLSFGNVIILLLLLIAPIYALGKDYSLRKAQELYRR